MKSKKPKGFSLVSVLVGLALAGGLSLLVAKLMSNSLKSASNLQQKFGRAELMSFVRDSVNCDATFKATGKSPTDSTFCNASVSDTVFSNPIQLKRVDASGIVTDIGAWDSTLKIHKVGNWSVRAGCSVTEGTLIIQAALLDASSNPAKDALGILQSWTNRQNIFAGPASISTPLCQSQFNKDTLSFVRAGASAIQNIPLKTSTKMTFGTILSDTLSEFSNGTFTAQYGGLYQVATASRGRRKFWLAVRRKRLLLYCKHYLHTSYRIRTDLFYRCK